MSAQPAKYLRAVLGVTLPYWACVAAFNIFNTYLFIKIGQVTAVWDTPWERLQQHLMMLPFLLAAYYAALRVRGAAYHRWMAFGLQAAIALAFSFIYRPSLQLGYGLGHHESWPVMLHYLRILAFTPWAEAVSQYIWCLLLYLLGLLLLFNVVFYMELHDERARAHDLQLRWLGARLEVLRGQLNPHFLFNSLNTVSSLVISKPDRAQGLITELSDLLRRMLAEQHSEYVSVREELDYIRKYLSVEQTRFGDRLQVVIEADAGALEAQLPAFILQPLVENAVMHGIGKNRGRGELCIVAERHQERLSVSISNTTAAPGEAAAGHGIGLSNVRERLAAIYPDSYDLVAGQDGSGRWITRISVPAAPSFAGGMP